MIFLTEVFNIVGVYSKAINIFAIWIQWKSRLLNEKENISEAKEVLSMTFKV